MRSFQKSNWLSWRCFRTGVGVGLVVFWNIALIPVEILWLRAFQENTAPPRAAFLMGGGIFLLFAAFSFLVVGSHKVRQIVFHPDREHYYNPRDLAFMGAVLTFVGAGWLIY